MRALPANLWLLGFGFLCLLLGASAQELSLAEVTRFDSRATGYAGVESVSFLAFKREVERGAEARALFNRLLREGPPAAQLYAAVGLYNLDTSEGTEALRSLLKNTSPVGTSEGCDVEETTVAAVAQRLLETPAAIRSYLPRLEQRF